MFKIGKLYHVIHVVDDFDAAERWYADVFAVRILKERNIMREAMREANLSAIGPNMIVEPLRSIDGPGVEHSAIWKFQRRYGRHWHSLAWYVEDGPACYEHLRSEGLRVYDMAGQPVLETPPPDLPLYTHPKETHGAIEFAPLAGWPERRVMADWDPAFWRDRHPLGIERCSHVTVAVRDLAAARTVYERAFGAELLSESAGPERHSAFYQVGSDTVVELAQPIAGGTALAWDAERGDVVHAVTFKVRDAGVAERHLREQGLRTSGPCQGGFALDPADAMGALYGFTERSPLGA